MTSLPRRFAVFQGQDCLMPRHIAGHLQSSADGSAVSSLLPETVSWPASEIPLELFSGMPEGYSYSAFAFENIVYGAVLLKDDEAHFVESAGLKNGVRFPVRNLALNFSSRFGRFVLFAKAHAQWASVSRFCGACGSPLVDANGNDEVREPLDDHAHGARFCPRCKRIFFPRMSPAVIVLVRKDNAILLEHNVRFPGNRHSLIAGFVEIGETLEEAAVREIREEAGIEVKNLQYVRSQPWPFPDSLMLGFIADWASGEARPDGVEIDHLDWYTANNLPEMPMRGSIARYIIDTFAAGGFSAT
ncbi:putative NAD(+) diphosphatase [uncultured spirochete]|uniref:NAD(+) diphosphatase n=1 Tax=uncultured spirochete TaxID=156406 RepID=A0A3P3XSL6_9SPIR|nr:putative NAD(+) diphosphatase [uncultured spirochete]